MQSPNEVEFVQLLLSRLERISVDSYWAHRASGVRGALLKITDEPDMINDYQTHMDELITSAFKILTHAAKEKDRFRENSDRLFR